MKKLLCLCFLTILCIPINAQVPEVCFGDYKTGEWGDWNIIEYSEADKEIYAFLDEFGFNLIRFDTDFNIKVQTKTKIKSGTILSVRKGNSHIDVITEKGQDIMHYTFDSNSLQNISSENLFRLPNMNFYNKEYFTEVCWSANGQFLGIVACVFPKDPGVSYTDYMYYMYLYDKDFHLLNHVEFPYMQHKIGTKKFSRPTWTITDNGELVYAALHVTTKPKKYPEYGESGCMMDVSIITKDNVKKQKATNIDPGGCMYDVFLYAAGNIAKYDGKQMQVFIANTLYQYNLIDNTVLPLCTFKYYQQATSMTGLSSYINDGEGGYAMNSGRGWTWIKAEPLKSICGGWGSAYVQQGNALFFPRRDAYSSQVTFFYKNKLYHIDNINTERFVSRKYKLTQLLCIDETGVGSTIEIKSNAKNDLQFYQLSENRFLVWERNAKIEKKYMQRLGFFGLK